MHVSHVKNISGCPLFNVILEVKYNICSRELDIFKWESGEVFANIGADTKKKLHSSLTVCHITISGFILTTIAINLRQMRTITGRLAVS